MLMRGLDASENFWIAHHYTHRNSESMETCWEVKCVYKVFRNDFQSLESREIHDQDVLSILSACLGGIPSQGTRGK